MSLQHPWSGTVYLAPFGFEALVEAELPPGTPQIGRLFFWPGPPLPSFWAQNIWLSALTFPFTSISQAATFLHALQPSWHLHPPPEHIRRAVLIQEKLPFRTPKPKPFPFPFPKKPLGSWTLLDRDLLVASGLCSSFFPDGEIHFLEDREGPPSRAYLKLWEALTLYGQIPAPTELCLDLGASPGGWTWALAHLPTRILAVDRSPLHPDIAALPGVSFSKGDAFSIRPKNCPAIDWLFSDVICYPEKLYDFLSLWIEAKACKHIVCTIKFQGSEHYAALPRFAAIPHSRLLHLSHNKHELTFFWTRPL